MSHIVSLVPFPSENIPPLAISVGIQFLPDNSLGLIYTIQGDLSQLCVPGLTIPSRADNLWQHTCFEVFLATVDSYREINLSPSSQWQAYTFKCYREGSPLDNIPAPSITSADSNEIGSGRFVLQAILPPSLLPIRLTRLGLSVVVEERERGLSYWALCHPGPRPDFHHPDSLAIPFPHPFIPSPYPV